MKTPFRTLSLFASLPFVTKSGFFSMLNNIEKAAKISLPQDFTAQKFKAELDRMRWLLQQHHPSCKPIPTRELFRSFPKNTTYEDEEEKNFSADLSNIKPLLQSDSKILTTTLSEEDQQSLLSSLAESRAGKKFSAY